MQFTEMSDVIIRIRTERFRVNRNLLNMHSLESQKSRENSGVKNSSKHVNCIFPLGVEIKCACQCKFSVTSLQCLVNSTLLTMFQLYHAECTIKISPTLQESSMKKLTVVRLTCFTSILTHQKKFRP